MQGRVKLLLVRAWLWLDARDKCPCLLTGRLVRTLKLDDTDAGGWLHHFMMQTFCGSCLKWYDQLFRDE